MIPEMSSSTVKHFSHPKHPLVLKENDVIGDDTVCYGCNEPVTGVPTYTCASPDDFDSQNFYFHKSCAELPTQINHHKHNIHSLTLFPRRHRLCDVCGGAWDLFTYSCIDCDFYVCVFCALEQRVLHHEGHNEHTLMSTKKKALFSCVACSEEAKDSSYVCTICEI